MSYGTIETSQTKAKAISGLVDKIINSAKSKNARGQLQTYFSSKVLQDRIIKEILPKLGSRTSGYTSLVKLGTRLGDQTMMVRMSLIGAEELKPLEKKEKVKEAKPAEKKVEKKEIKKETPVKKPTRKTRKTKKT